MAKKMLFCMLLTGVLMILGACGTHTEQMLENPDIASVPDGAEGSATKQDGSETSGIGGEDGLSIGVLDEQDSAAGSASDSGTASFADSGNVIYFEYNSSEIRDEFLPLIIRIAKKLEENSTMKLRLEGHADERGTREYNLALGERRAREVRNLIILQGVHDKQVDIVSYGEEKPAVTGSGEEFWQQNRRVELVH